MRRNSARCICAALFALSCLLVCNTASADAPKPIHCTILQTLPPATDADRALSDGDAANAEGLYQAQLTAARSPAAFAGVVHSQLEQNKLTEALASAEQAVKALPTSPEGHVLVAEVLFRMGKIPEAHKAVFEGLALDQCSARAHMIFGKLNLLVARRGTAAHELGMAHALAPADPRITAEYLPILPADQRLALLRTLLAAHPLLPVAMLDRLVTERAELEQHKVCHVIEPFTHAKLTLEPLFLYGKYPRSWGLKLRIDGKDVPTLELDSSVSGIVLSTRDADRAGVHPLTALPSSPDLPYAAFADSVRVGNLEYHDCPVKVVPNAALAGANSLIGTDFFRDHLIQIDYVAQSLNLDAYPPRPDTSPDEFVPEAEKDWSPVYIANGNILLPTLINKKGPYLFALDTGSAATIIAPAVNAAVLSASTNDTTLNLEGISGQIVKVIEKDGGGNVSSASVQGPTGNILRVTRPVKEPTLRFTRNEYADEYAVSFDLTPKSHTDGIEVSGMLGFYVLQGFLIDLNYRDGLARILFDQNHRYAVQQRTKTTHYN